MSVGETTQRKAEHSLEEVKHKGEEALDHAKDAAGDVLETGKARAEEELTYGKGVVAQQVRDAANAAKAAARDLRERDQAMLAGWADMAADNMSHAAQSLDGRDIGEIFSNVENFARRQPAVFLAGVALAGFAAARFAKAARDGAAERSAHGHGSAHYASSHSRPPAPGTTNPGYRTYPPKGEGEGQTIVNRNHEELNNV